MSCLKKILTSYNMDPTQQPLMNDDDFESAKNVLGAEGFANFLEDLRNTKFFEICMNELLKISREREAAAMKKKATKVLEEFFSSNEKQLPLYTPVHVDKKEITTRGDEIIFDCLFTGNFPKSNGQRDVSIGPWRFENARIANYYGKCLVASSSFYKGIKVHDQTIIWVYTIKDFFKVFYEQSVVDNILRVLV